MIQLYSMTKPHAPRLRLGGFLCVLALSPLQLRCYNKGMLNSILSRLSRWIKERTGLEDGPVYKLLPPGAPMSGITLWPLGIFIKGSTKKNIPCLIAHEQVHWDSQRKAPVVWFAGYLAWWVILFIKNRKPPYREHPMEREAYLVEDQCVANSSIDH